MSMPTFDEFVQEYWVDGIPDMYTVRDAKCMNCRNLISTSKYYLTVIFAYPITICDNCRAVPPYDRLKDIYDEYLIDKIRKLTGTD